MNEKNLPQQRIESEIDILELLMVYLDHIWVILLCVVLLGGLAFGYSIFKTTPTYTATAKLYMFSSEKNSLINLSTLTKSTTLKNDYQEILNSRPIMQQVADNLNQGLTVKSLRKMVKISMKEDTNILEISATSTSPQTAMDVANEIAEQAVVSVPVVMDCTPPNLLESAIFPTNSNGRGIGKRTALGMMAGLVLSCGVLTLQFMMNDTFRGAEDLEKYTGVSVLTAIPEADEKDINRSAKTKRNAEGGR